MILFPIVFPAHRCTSKRKSYFAFHCIHTRVISEENADEGNCQAVLVHSTADVNKLYTLENILDIYPLFHIFIDAYTSVEKAEC